MAKVFLESKDEFLKKILEKNLADEGIEVMPFNEEEGKRAEVVVVEVKSEENLKKIRMIRAKNGRTVIFALVPYKDEKLREKILNAGADELLQIPLEEDETKILFPMLFASYKLGSPYSRGRMDDFLKQVKKVVNLFHQSENLSLTLLEKLQQVAAFRDNDTSEHTQRVGKISQFLAEEIGLPPKQAISIRITAPLHDIGKIGIPDSILFKKGPLNDKEWEIMKMHTQIGAKILESDVDILRCARNIALYHHERYDGKGYPTQLAGEKIPIEARIVTVADSFDAIVSKRPYKPPRSHGEGVEELKKNSGSQFDPRVVEAFIKISKQIFSLYGRLSKQP